MIQTFWNIVLLNTNFNSIVPIHIYLLIYFYFREKCLLPLQLALESKSMKLAQQALAGMQVWLKSGVCVGSGCQGNSGVLLKNTTGDVYVFWWM